METQNVARNKLYQSFLKIPHRQYGQIVPEFRAAMDADPDFIARACVDMATGGTEIRDLADCSVITLLTSSPSLPGYREAGVCALLGRTFYPNIQPTNMRVPGIPVYSPRIFRIFDYINRDTAHKAPRLMRGIAVDYLTWLEADQTRFDSLVMRNRKAIKNMYVHFHIRMSAYAKAVLYDNKPPAGSKLAVLKQIAASNDANEQARLIIENNIPYVIASSLVAKMSPVVGVALIAVMSPQEALNSRAWVERSGLLGMKEVRSAYEDKVGKASASAATTAHRASAQGTDEGVQAVVEKAAQKAVDKQQHIEDSVLLLMDHSGSMEHSISITAELASRVAPLCTGEFTWVAFNDMARLITLRDRTLQGAKQAVAGIRAGGGTNGANAFAFALKQGIMPQKIVVVSDGAMMGGDFGRTVASYQENTGIVPKIVFLRVPGDHDNLARNMDSAGLQFDRFETDGTDYYVYDQVAQALGGPAGQSLVERILEITLPYRG